MTVRKTAVMVTTPGIPFFDLNRFELLAAGDGHASCATEVTPWLAGTPEMGIQAAAAALGDAVHMYAASSRRAKGSMPVTVDLRLDFWSDPPPLGARLVGTANVEPALGDVLLVRGQIESGDTVIATGTARAMLTPASGPPASKGEARRPATVELVPPPASVRHRSEGVDAVLDLPAARLSALELAGLGEGTIEFTAAPGHELERTMGVVHGGAVVALGSLASAGALASSLAGGTHTRTIGLTTEFLRPTPIGSPLRLRARVTHRTRRLATVHAEIVTEDRRPTARLYESVAIESVDGA
jgi:uncharacterized protein (TIGR00369 family)